MQVFVNMSDKNLEGTENNDSQADSVVNNHELTQSKKQFLKELAKGYLDAERMKKLDLLNLYKSEYEVLEDKDSLKGQYLESWIYVLTKEIKN